MKLFVNTSSAFLHLTLDADQSGEEAKREAQFSS